MAIRITVWIQGLFSGFVMYREIRKVVNGHSFILIRQMAALVGHVLAEVCIVPVLRVFIRYDTMDCINVRPKADE